MEIKRINQVCAAYPCHKELEDCTFCYCPIYPCNNTERGGRYLTIYNGTSKEKIWDCSNCNWIHQKDVVDKIFENIKESLIVNKKDK